ncbi:unnamed protein product [Knipowitschia caucasica]|uniref:Secreted protein n=1 Tax=Knipowitschia caucasica TaxID=637954 RepID=A0AAV2L7W7_KNICA
MKTLLLPLALVAALLCSASTVPIPGPVPYHAFCRSMWLFATPCAAISSALEQQIVALSPVTGCGNCFYNLVSVTPLAILANHTSPDGLTAETLSFKFLPSVLTGGCRVNANSQSIAFTSLLDNGLNYCNLYNILSASGLSAQPDFMEMTNEWACLGYGLASCK